MVVDKSAQDKAADEKAARFTILIDADKKKAFDDLCASQDVTSSQMIRQLIKDYLDRHGVDVEPGPLRTKRLRRTRAS
ncbi:MULTISPECIES: ribbon-helix-helix protein, CopG family [Ramlibacter]|uniref:Ribbon-helix-helix protein, CopG family n=1 Tax=Ramlibacter pinisoli TaxID=2682844 RepID=A0A6N8INX8_9BURK|nr:MULTISPECIES: ribbon-helix-helix protein, CopG family [Ramlibacter]MBA2963573.1 CopG family transcriptional regulator [Ramlibacter sp. CGMCC 1.13660]MVQ28538.1 ribbon-helix-helix protein, CopG family [Ramlibacter pinisoli]